MPPQTPSRNSSKKASQLCAANMRLPKTPVSRHIYAHAPSSRPSTPGSSPARVVNLVSSPGPMRAEPDVEEDLPYTTAIVREVLRYAMHLDLVTGSYKAYVDGNTDGDLLRRWVGKML